MVKYLLVLFAVALFAGSLVIGVTVAGLTTQQQSDDSIILGGSSFSVTIGGGGTLPVQAIGFRPGTSSEEPFNVTLDASPAITAKRTSRYLTILVPSPRGWSDGNRYT